MNPADEIIKTLLEDGTEMVNRPFSSADAPVEVPLIKIEA